LHISPLAKSDQIGRLPVE